MHTLATAQKTAAVDNLVNLLVANGATVKLNTAYTKTVEKDGVRIMSAIGMRSNWSVQVAAHVAQQHNLPLWKDLV